MSVLTNIIKSILGICETKPLSQSLWSVEANRVRVKFRQVPELNRPGGAVYLKGKGLRKPILIVRTDDARFLAFANRCTHAGRKLDPVPGKPLLRCCSLSHSVFDYDGNNVKGPARKPLMRYETNLLEDELVIII